MSESAAMTFCWLIERGQPEGQEPTVWWSGDEKIGWGGWTPDPHAAYPYLSKDEADAVIRARFFGPCPAQGASAHAVEHGFEAVA